MKYYNFLKFTSFLIIFILLSFIFGIYSTFAGWSTPRRISEPAASYYPQIIAQGDTLHVIYVNGYGGTSMRYIRSSDGGLTWSQPRNLLATGTNSPFFPQIIRNGNRLMVLWRVYIVNSFYHYNISYSISDNNGLNWSSAENALNLNLERPFTLTASGSSSLINITCTSGYADTSYFRHIRSTNFGQTWNLPETIFTSMQVGKPNQVSNGGFVHLVWDGRYNLDQKWEIHNTNSTNRGLNWSPNFTLSDSDQYHSILPVICADNINLKCIWMDYKYSPYIATGDIFLRQSDDFGSTWNPEIQTTFDHLALESDIASMGDTLAVAWEDENPENGYCSIFCIKSTNGGESWDEPYWVDADTNYSFNPSIACSHGKIFLIWYDTQLPDSTGIYFSRFDFETDAIGQGNGDNLPDMIGLSAYPNPFNSSVNITYSSKKGGEIKIYGASGQLIRSFMVEAAEEGKVVWDVKDKGGMRAASGTYIVRFLSNGISKTVKLIYLK